MVCGGGSTAEELPGFTVVVRCRDCDYKADSPTPFVYKYYCRRHMLDFKHRTYLSREYINNDNTSSNDEDTR
jgi:hypothetical protein